jgi:hypothetical protein
MAANGGTTVSGHIEAGARSVVLHVPLTKVATPVRVTVTGSGGTLTGTSEPQQTSLSLLSEPIVFRAMASPRAPLQPVADMRFLRSERVRVEWTTTGRLDRRDVRLLDRTGRPLAIQVNVTEREISGRTFFDADLSLAPLATGDYLIEVTAALGAAPAERRLIAIHVER